MPLTVSRLAIVFCLIGSSVLSAQGTKANYENAATYKQRMRDCVFRDQLTPRWIKDGPSFWYQVSTSRQSTEFILVDPVAGTRKPAFDHNQLAHELTQAGNLSQSGQLPLQNLEFITDSGLRFTAYQKRWQFGEDGLKLIANNSEGLESTARLLAAIQPSKGGGAETAIQFRNNTDGVIELAWITPKDRRVSYGSIAAHQSRSQHTFTGHTWLLTNEEGKHLACFEAVAGECLAIIDASSQLSSRTPNQKEPQDDTDNSFHEWAPIVRDHNVFLENTSTQESVQLTQNGTENDAYQDRFYWSPDRSRFAVMQIKSTPKRTIFHIESAPTDQLQPKLHETAYVKPGDPLPVARPRVFDIASKKRISFADTTHYAGAWSITKPSWSADSNCFRFLYNARGHQTLRVISLDCNTGVASVIVDEHSPTFIDYAYKTILRYLPESKEILWASESSGWNHLYRYDESGNRKNAITNGEWVVRGVESVDTTLRQIWFRASGVFADQDPYFMHLGRVDFDGTNLTWLTQANGNHEWTFSPDRKFLIDTWSRVDQPKTHDLRRADNGDLICNLESPEISELKAAGWIAPEPFVALGRDRKTNIHGIIVRPTDFSEDKSYPVIEKIYAGPHGSFVPKSFGRADDMAILAEHGFIVVQIDGMGTSNRSKAFHDVCWKNLGDSGFPDRIAWLQSASATYPQMDLSKVGIYGGSAGGQSALRALLAHGNFYHVAVADCGCHDNRMDKIWWNEQWMGWPISDHYAAQSNVTQAHRLQGKLFLTVGELDKNVDPASTMQVVDALIKADKDFDLLVVPGAGHGVGERPYAKRRRTDFFVRHLLGVEPRHEPAQILLP